MLIKYRIILIWLPLSLLSCEFKWCENSATVALHPCENHKDSYLLETPCIPGTECNEGGFKLFMTHNECGIYCTLEKNYEVDNITYLENTVLFYFPSNYYIMDDDYRIISGDDKPPEKPKVSIGTLAMDTEINGIVWKAGTVIHLVNNYKYSLKNLVGTINQDISYRGLMIPSDSMISMWEIGAPDVHLYTLIPPEKMVIDGIDIPANSIIHFYDQSIEVRSIIASEQIVINGVAYERCSYIDLSKENEIMNSSVKCDELEAYDSANRDFRCYDSEN